MDGNNNLSVQPQKSSPKGLIAFVIAVLILGSAGFVALRNNQGNNPQNPNPQKQGGRPIPTSTILTSPLAPRTLVYGGWTGAGSLVKALDLTSGTNKALALLPTNIKKVTVLSPDQLLYIGKTDDRDHGTQITRYSIADKKEQAVVATADGFGIDDYVISPNKRYLATWEVAFAPGSSVLRGGKSRVYTVDLNNPSAKNLVYDETAGDTPVHYPRAILDNGKVFMDTFLPNGGTGWAYGMSVANFNGSGKQDLAQMKNGTYATQPSLSENGQKLLFAGYDGSNGPGDAVKNGYRQALVTPNTVETLNTNTLVREKLPNLSNANTYTTVHWDKTTGNILYTSISQNTSDNGLFSYNLSAKSAKKVNLSSNESAFVTVLSADKLLAGVPDNSPSSLGNLGEAYSSSYREFSVVDTNTSTLTPLKLSDPLMQYIGLVPTDYFPDTVQVQAQGVQVPSNVTPIDLYSNQNSQKANLQLYTFFLKTNLEPVRKGQQSDPIPTSAPIPTSGGTIPTSVVIPTSGSQPPPSGQACRDLAAAQCQAKGLAVNSHEYNKCFSDTFFAYRQSDACSDSPLYLYGKEGQLVQVQVQTPVSSSTPSYNDGYNVTLLRGGKLLVDGNVYESITYDYTPAVRRLTIPPYGSIVSADKVANTLSSYGRRLGLNEKEISDLVAFGKQHVTSPYAFVSFYDQKRSQDILPLSFTPKPDNYLNVVFYFKLLADKPNFTPIPPVFGKPLERTGFTAVEVSEIVE